MWRFAPSHGATRRTGVMFPAADLVLPPVGYARQPEHADRRTIMPLRASLVQPGSANMTQNLGRGARHASRHGRPALRSRPWSHGPGPLPPGRAMVQQVFVALTRAVRILHFKLVYTFYRYLPPFTKFREGRVVVTGYPN